MAPRRPWLGNYFGPWLLRVLGVELPERPTIELIAGTGVTIGAVDDPATEATKVTISATGGGGATPGGSDGDLQRNSAGALAPVLKADNSPPDENDVATYDGTKWVAAPPTGNPSDGDGGEIQKSDGAGGFIAVSHGSIGGVLRQTGSTTSSFGALDLANANATTNTLAGSKVAAATTSDPGTMSAADKTKLDGMQPQGTAVAVPALAIDWAAGTVFSKTLAAGSNTFTFSNATSGRMIVISVTGAASTVTWPAGIKWPGGAAPTQTASGTDVYTFFHNGTSILGSVVQNLS